MFSAIMLFLLATISMVFGHNVETCIFISAYWVNDTLRDIIKELKK